MAFIEPIFVRLLNTVTHRWNRSLFSVIYLGPKEKWIRNARHVYPLVAARWDSADSPVKIRLSVEKGGITLYPANNLPNDEVDLSFNL